MIRLGWDELSRTFVSGVAPGVEAYVDADWLLEVGDAGVPALVASEENAARALFAVAAAAAAAAGSAQRAAVGGNGLVARRTRELLSAGDETLSTAPDVVVETRPGPKSLLEATTRVADLGTVVLAGPPAPPFHFDLYPDVHVRGLHVVSVPSAEELGAGPVPSSPAPVTVRVDEPLPDGAAWYRVVPR
jgi:hypothetical protein